MQPTEVVEVSNVVPWFARDAGAVTINKLEHKRLVDVLDRYLGGIAIEQLRVPCETAYIREQGTEVGFVEAESDNLAAAVGASIANPLLFAELNVRSGNPTDPGLDRVGPLRSSQ